MTREVNTGIPDRTSDASRRQPDVDYSPLLAATLLLFRLLAWLAPMRWLQIKKDLFRPRSRLHLCETRDPVFVRRRARAIELYLLAWLGVQLSLATLLIAGVLPHWLSLLAAAIALLRIIEILRETIGASILDALYGRAGQRVASRARMIVLAGFNFVELLLCFGIVYSADIAHLRGASGSAAAFYFSVITQLTIGYGDIAPLGWVRLVVVAQGLLGTLFLLLVFGRFVASLPQLQGVLDRLPSLDQDQGAVSNQEREESGGATAATPSKTEPGS